MLIDNYHHLQAPIEAPDDSLEIAAEAASLVRDIDEAMASLIAAKRAAENEDNVEARTLVGNARFALDVALMPEMED